jgi:hypothetical protein
MTSFAVAIEPRAQSRLAALALLVHLAAAAGSWIARVPPALAAPLSLLALASLASTLAAVPGPHHRLAGLRRDCEGCRVRLREGGPWRAAEIGPRSWAIAGLACLDVRAGGQRYAWLLPRGAAPAGPFRRLKAWIRVSC